MELEAERGLPSTSWCRGRSSSSSTSRPGAPRAKHYLLSHHGGLKGRVGEPLDACGLGLEAWAWAVLAGRSLFLQECAASACT